MYDFIFNNSNKILEKSTKNIFFYNSYRFKILGQGSFGIVYKVYNQKHNFIIKIMKKKNKETLILKNLKKVIDSKKNLDSIIKNYIIDIKEIYIQKDPNVIIFENLEMDDLNKFINSNEYITEEDFYIIISKIILSILLLHNKLNYSHRDIKPSNILFNPKTYKLKIIDFGFSCKNDDVKCFETYQGTGNYIHPKMNSIKQNKNSFFIKTKKKKNINKKTKKKQNNDKYPNPKNQDIFAIIIIILKLYQFIEITDSKEEIKLNKFISRYFSHNIKKNNLKKYQKRLNKKKKLFSNLNTIKSNEINNPVIKILLELLKSLWDFNKFNFKEDKSNYILKKLLDISTNNIKNLKEKKKIQKDKKLIY